VIDLEQGCTRIDAGVVHPDVEAVELLDGLVGKRGDRRAVSHLDFECVRPCSESVFDARRRGSRGCDIEVTERDGRARFGKARRDRAPDALRAAGDHCSTSVEAPQLGE
jgi:hypothetical protein